MPTAMAREVWTDERLDDLSRSVSEVRAEVRELRTEVAHVREELGELRAEVKGVKEATDAKFDAVDKRFDDVMRTMQIGFGIIGGIMTAMLGLLGLIATQV
jgi:regulator of replication initiation timing